jgi:hypothetical protein
MHKIAIEEHFLLRELDDYFHTLEFSGSAKPYSRSLKRTMTSNVRNVAMSNPPNAVCSNVSGGDEGERK